MKENRYADKFIAFSEVIDKKFRLNHDKIPEDQRQIHEHPNTPGTIRLYPDENHDMRSRTDSTIDKVIHPPFEHFNRVRTYIAYCRDGYGLGLFFATDFNVGDVAGIYYGQ